MYHVSHQGQQFGPYTVEQINQYLSQGAFDASSHVWDANTNGWIEICQLQGVVLPPQAVPVSTQLHLAKSMTHKEKVEYFKKDLQQRGHGKSNADPLICRWLWAVGIKTPPPVFWSYISYAAFMGVPFGIGMGIFGFFNTYDPNRRGSSVEQSLIIAAVIMLVGGIFFGMGMASMRRKIVLELNLPPWEKYPSG